MVSLVLLAPDKFKGSLSAIEVAGARIADVTPPAGQAAVTGA